MAIIKKFILLTEHPQLHSSQRLLEEAKRLHLDVQCLNPYDHILTVLSKSQMAHTGHLIFHRTTGIRHKDYDLDVSQQLMTQGAHVVNKPEAFLHLRDKERQAIFCQRHEIPAIPTISMRRRPTKTDIDYISNQFKDYTAPCNPNFIVKTLRGNQGVGVNLIKGLQSLMGILETFWAIQDQDFLIQPYLENSREIRVICSHGEILASIQRIPSKLEYRANSDRGEASLMSASQLPHCILDIVSKIYNTSKAQYFALDIMEFKNNFFVIEINLVPGFKQMESLTNINIASRIIQDALKTGISP